MIIRTKSFKNIAGIEGFDISISEEGSVVNVSLNSNTSGPNGLSPAHYARHYWKMKLIREGKVIGTRTGYVSINSPSHRTFTNIGNLGSHVWAEVTFTGSTDLNYEGSQRRAPLFKGTYESYRLKK